MNILVRNLCDEVTEALLMAAFQRFGTVASVSIMIDKASGNSRGFGFVEMPDEAEAKAAIEALHHKNIEGQKVRVKEANPNFGVAFYTEGEGAIAVEQKLVPTHPAKRPAAQKEKRELEPRRERSFDKQKERADSRREFKPRGEGNFAPRSSGERSSRPYSRFPAREGGGRDFKPAGEQDRRPQGAGFKPRGERSFERKKFGDKGKRPFSHAPSREGGRPEFKPRGEGMFAQRSTGVRSNTPYSRPAREGTSGEQDRRPQGASSGAKPHAERSFERYRTDGINKGSGHGAKPHGGRTSKPFSRFGRQGSGRKDFKPGGDKPRA